jgi:hypothetical protein
MGRKLARFRMMDVQRAMKGALAAGIDRPRVEIDPAGKIVVMMDRPDLPLAVEPEEEANPWDEAV